MCWPKDTGHLEVIRANAEDGYGQHSHEVQKAYDSTKTIANDTFNMKAIYESYEIGEIDRDCLTLKNGIVINSQVMSEVFHNSFELVFYVVALYGYEAADEAEESMFNRLLLDHWGTAYIECADSWVGKTIAKSLEEEGIYATHSFSSGQSDIPLEMQTPIFELLMPDEIGVSLNDRYMMHPKKNRIRNHRVQARKG